MARSSQFAMGLVDRSEIEQKMKAALATEFRINGD